MTKKRQYGTSRHQTIPRHLYGKRYYNAKVRGEDLSLVPAGPSRKHVLELREYGLTINMIAAAAGCNRTTICNLIEDTYPTIRRETAARIRTVTHLPHPEQALCLTIGARRRAYALAAIGWPLTELSTRIGVSQQSLWLTLTRQQMAYTTWAAIRDAYEQLSGTPGPNSAWAKRYRAKGHPPPLAWDGSDIDHPHAQPDWAAAGIKLAERPVCKRGHPWTAENTGRDNRGTRYCRTCRRTKP